MDEKRAEEGVTSIKIQTRSFSVIRQKIRDLWISVTSREALIAMFETRDISHQ